MLRVLDQVWQAMLDEGVVPHGGMLASYVLALMKSGDWELALEVRDRYIRPRSLILGLSSGSNRCQGGAIECADTAMN